MSLKKIARIDNKNTPEEWPNPHVIPFFKASFGLVIEEGAIAIRWSAPLTTWITPATNPVDIMYCIKF